MLVRIFLASTLGLIAGCVVSSAATTGGTGDCTQTATVSNVSGKLHGQACTQNSECKYGVCSQTAMVLVGVGSIGICTKECNCGANSSCDLDNVLDANKNIVSGFDCARQGSQAQCAYQCTSDDQCKAWNPSLPYCLAGYDNYFSVGTHVCAAKPAP